MFKERAFISYYKQYAPHRALRSWVSIKIYYWADNKYGVKARGEVTNGFTEKQKEMLNKWQRCMDIKNKVNNRIGKTL